MAPTARRGLFAGLVTLAVLSFTHGVSAHDEHALIGRSDAGQLRLHPLAGHQAGTITPLAAIPPGGVIEGFSASEPGYSMVVYASPENDVYPPATGADVWLEITRIDPALLLIKDFQIIHEQDPPELRIGSGSQAHVHPLWLLDAEDPAYDLSRCLWEITFVLKDKGTTGYADSEPITFVFSAGPPPSPADLNCDGEVDDEDTEIFLGYMTGANVPYDPDALPAGCLFADHAGFIRADLDRDGDVDMSDFGLFQRCLSGDGVAAGPDCLD